MPKQSRDASVAETAPSTAGSSTPHGESNLDDSARRWAPVTALLVAIEAAVALGLWLKGVNPFEFRLASARESLKPWGASYGPLTAGGEGWRLATAMFVHANILHLVFDAWAIWVLGRFLEPLLGGFTFALVFLVCGFGGNLAALVWQPGDVVAGAGGVVFGLIAFWPAFSWRARGTAPALAVGRMRLALLAFLAYNVGGELIQGGFSPTVCLGGAACGFVVGLVLGRPFSAGPHSPGLLRTAALLLLAGALGWAATLTPRIDNFERAFEQLVAVDRTAEEIYRSARQEWEQGRLTNEAFADRIDDQIIFYWRSMADVFAGMHHVLPREEARLAATKEYLRRRDDAWQTLAEGLRKNDDELIEAARRKQAEADEAAKVLEAGGKG